MASPRIEHYSRTVENPKAVCDFFSKYFGFKLILERKAIEIPYFRQIIGYPDSTVDLYLMENDYGFQLEFFEFIRPKGTKQDLLTCNPGSTHLCFIVDDIFAIVEEMKRDGLGMRSQEPVYIDKGIHEGCYSIYILDPENTIIEMIQFPKP